MEHVTGQKPSGTGAETMEASGFPPTQWTLVSCARAPSGRQEEALNDLLRIYGPVLRRYLVGILRLRPEEAEDLVQEFVARRILEHRLLDRADRSRGRFRSFLLKCFLNFVNGERRKARAAKRGPPPSQMLPLDDWAEAIPDPRGSRKAFDSLWARQVLSGALDRMRRECEEKRRTDVWGVFERRLLGPAFSGDPPPSYEALVEEFQLQSPSQAANLLITAKRSFQRALESVVRDTVGDEDEVEEEIRALKRALASADSPGG